MASERKMNWNTILISAAIAFGGWGGKEIYTEIRVTHDAVIGQNYQIVDLRARMTALEMDWQKWKEKHP